QPRRVEVGVAVHDAVAHDLGLLEAGDELDHFLLVAPLEAGLETDQRPHPARGVLLAQLRDRVWSPAGAGVVEAHRFEGTEARRIAAATRQLLDGHATLEELEFL